MTTNDAAERLLWARAGLDPIAHAFPEGAKGHALCGVIVPVWPLNLPDPKHLCRDCRKAAR